MVATERASEAGEVRLTLEEARGLVVRTLARCRTDPGPAAAVGEALVGAEAIARASHGLSRMPDYASQAIAGKVDGRARPTAVETRPGVLAVDAAHGFAYPALALALERLPGMAAANGIAMAGVRRSHHAGVLGLAVERLAEAGLVALMVANAPASIAPWGGRHAVFGTNPIAFAAPVPCAAPLVIDLSVSRVARGNLMRARQRGEPIPEGWALDAEGRPTTDAEAALAGTMIPMGGAKGAALALMVEVLAAVLPGAGLSADASSLFDAEGPPPDLGQTIVAIDPGALGGRAALDRLTRLAALVATEPGARLPGRRAQAARARAEAEGVLIPAGLLARIETLGAAGRG